MEQLKKYRFVSFVTNLIGSLFIGPFLLFIRYGVISLNVKYELVGLLIFWLFFVAVKKKKCQINGKKFFFALLSVCFVCGLLNWGVNTFPLHDVDLTIMTVQMPLGGFTNFFIFDFIYKVFLPSLFFSFALFIPIKNIFESFIFPNFFGGLFFACILCVGGWHFFSIMNMDILQKYFFTIVETPTEVSESSFLKDNYVPYKSDMIVPLDSEKTTRNLILIFVESFENSFINYMPEMAEIYAKSIVFENILPYGGGTDVLGSGMTIAGQISKTIGLPMLSGTSFVDKISKEGHVFFEKEKSLYDVLQEKKYHNIYLQGTDAIFAGTAQYFLNHGMNLVYDVDDIVNDHVDSKELLSNSRPGIPDSYVLDVAKKILKNLSKDKFSLTITTIDTHFPFGFEDNHCKIEKKNYSNEEKFINVLQCTSKNIADFVNWIHDQPFAENTEIVIVGDHLFMGKVVVNKVSRENRRFICLFDNPYVIPQMSKREYSSFDVFPTILESLGFSIEGKKLGLGVSLFSTEKTLLEKFGLDSLNQIMMKVSTTSIYHSLF